MPSPTGVTELVRKKKASRNGKRNKKANAKRGTTNFLTMGFPSEQKAKKSA
jgi:hypothetical protein